jgi:creatinine amidohydrolase
MKKYSLIFIQLLIIIVSFDCCFQTNDVNKEAKDNSSRDYSIFDQTKNNKFWTEILDGYSQANDFTGGGYSIFNQTMVDMTWTDIEKAINNKAIVLLPVGVIEQHGPHISCGSDTYQSYISAKIVQRELNKNGIPTLIAPPFYWGIADLGNNFPGNFTVSESTMKSLLSDIFASLNKWGVKNIVVFNAHGETKHLNVLRASIIESHKTFGINIYLPMDRKYVHVFENTEFRSFIIPVDYNPPYPNYYRFDDCHAGAIETGIMVAFFPDLVDTLKARNLKPNDLRDYPNIKSLIEVEQVWARSCRAVTPMGYFGEPARYDAKISYKNYINNSKSEADAIKTFFEDK